MWSKQPRFQEIVQRCKKDGKQWVDPDFTASDTSLYTNTTRPPKDWPKVTEWKRVQQISPKAQLFVDGVEAGDVIQGALGINTDISSSDSIGDCWFLGALSVVATNPELLQKVVMQKELNEWGVYEFSFYKNGEWIFVAVDDFIPCNRGKPMFARCHDINEVWVMLIEKAYAKLHKCYENLEGGSESFALVDMTGGAPEEIKFDDKEGSAIVNTNRLWPKVLKYSRLGYLLGCAMLVPNATAEADAGKGILLNHAYGIIDGQEVNGAKLLRVRNPWGQGEWKGAWSDGSKEWTAAILSKLNYKFEDDGTFWIQLSDFVKQFNRFYIVRLFNNEWQNSITRGEWKGTSAGGCPNFPTWKNNPQYGFELTVGDVVLITLMQDDARMNGVRESPIAIGFLLLKTDDLTKKVPLLKAPDIIGQTVFNTSRELSKKFNLRAGKYVIVPSTFYPQKSVSYVLRVYYKSKVEVLLYNLLEGGVTTIRSNVMAAAKNMSTMTITGSPKAPPVTEKTLRNGSSIDNIEETIKPFSGVATRKFPPIRPANPLYQKSSDIYGKRDPQPHEKAPVYHGRKSTFQTSLLKPKN